MYDDMHDVPEQHMVWMRTALGLKDNATVPEAMIVSYWAFKNVFDRFGNGLQARDIILLAYLEGYGNPTAKELEPPTIVQLFRNGKVKAGDPVSIVWRKKPCTGRLVGVNGMGLPIVLVDGASDEHTVPVKDVAPIALQLA